MSGGWASGRCARRSTPPPRAVGWCSICSGRWPSSLLSGHAATFASPAGGWPPDPVGAGGEEPGCASSRTRAAARARGRSGGRRSKLGAEQRRTARTLYDERQLTVAQIGQVLGVSRTSIYGALGQDTAAASGAARPACCPRSPPRGAEHDFWAPYWHFDVTHAVCGAHLGRELAAAANVDGQADWAGGLDRLLLVEINRTVTAARAAGADELAPELLATYRCRYGDRDSAVVGGRSEGTRIGSSAASTREAPRGVSWRWVSLRPGRMAIVDRTNPWPAVVALAGRRSDQVRYAVSAATTSSPVSAAVSPQTSPGSTPGHQLPVPDRATASTSTGENAAEPQPRPDRLDASPPPTHSAVLAPTTAATPASSPHSPPAVPPAASGA